jgi:hypothetical protein
LSTFKEPRNRFPAWWAGTTVLVDIGWQNRFLGIDSKAPEPFTNSGSGQKAYHVIEELPEGAPVLLLLEPEGVEVQAEGGPICIVMSS